MKRLLITTLSLCLGGFAMAQPQSGQPFGDGEGSRPKPGGSGTKEGHPQQQRSGSQGKFESTENFVNRVTITTENGFRVINANGIPNHDTGAYPNQNNPNAISEQQHQFKIPMEPKVAAEPTELKLGKFGIGLNGVPFDPGAAEFYNNDRSSGWQYEALSGKANLGLDHNNAHVQPNGSYHYHGMPWGLVQMQGKGGDTDPRKSMVHLGYAADGYPIYNNYGYTDPTDPNSELKKLMPSYQTKKGTRKGGPGGRHDGTFVQDYEYVEGSGDLDEFNGRTGVTPQYPDGTFYYVISETFPFIPRKLKGEPDQSFMKRGGGGGPGGQGGRGQGMRRGGSGEQGGQRRMGPPGGQNGQNSQGRQGGQQGDRRMGPPPRDGRRPPPGGHPPHHRRGEGPLPRQ